jgi:uncharacterized membrane protein
VSSPLLLGDASDGWRYAGWIALDLRLLIFVGVVAALVAVGTSALFVRSGRWRDHFSVFFFSFPLALVLLTLLFNGFASHPVVVVERLFPFP